MAIFPSQLRIILCVNFYLGSIASKLPQGKWQTLNTNSNIESKNFGLKQPSCPPWKYYKFFNSSCECGDSIHDIVLCDEHDDDVFLLTCHCMSYSDHSDMMLVGDCPYLCTNNFYTHIFESTNITDLCNRDIQQNRKGQMCGKCLDNFAPSPYSFSFECSNCSDYKHNWIKYIAIAYVPLTIFFLAVIIFRFNAMSPSVTSFVLVCQILSCPATSSLISVWEQFLIKNSNNESDPNIKILAIVQTLSTTYGVWNLDFFRMVYEPFCLHPSMSILQIISLDYAISMYPLIVIVFVYLLIKLHERFEMIQFLWRPAARIFICISKQWKTSNSLIQAFGTFILLSYVKVINTSFDILMPVQLHNVSGQVVGLYVYYNGSLEYFGHDHLPYAVLAIFMFTTFNLIPLLLLCLYPCRCFQSCLNCCRLNSQVLRTFMDAFQGCYKFEPYDCRYWAAFYLFLRIAVLVIFALTQSGYFILVTGILLVPIASLLSVVRPYRENIYNIIDSVMFLALIQLCFSTAGFSLTSFDRRYEAFVTITFGIGALFPPIYAILLLVKNITPSNLLATLKRYILCLVLCKEKVGLQRNESIDSEEPLLGDSAESQLPGDEEPHYNSLLNYTI